MCELDDIVFDLLTIRSELLILWTHLELGCVHQDLSPWSHLGLRRKIPSTSELRESSFAPFVFASVLAIFC